MTTSGPPRDLFTDIGTAGGGFVALTTGAPGERNLRRVASLLEKGTQHLLVGLLPGLRSGLLTQVQD